jgi:hypothetical protein
MIDIRKYACVGENKIEMSVLLEQTAETYENIEKAAYFESNKNKLVYDMEIESIYLVGDFAVECGGDIVEGDRGAAFFADAFSIVSAKDTVTLSNIERQGYPFFSGSMTLKKKFVLDSTDYKIEFNKQGINAIKLRVNGQDVRTILWAPYATDISEFLKVGENEVEITDPTEYFNTRCVLEEDDYKTGYNGWLQVYQKLLSRYHTLTQISSTHTDMFKLDYDEQEDTMWMSKILE